ncbi:hypothetical protein ACTFIZ_007704 [Dictyostelium cf. discoideum]
MNLYKSHGNCLSMRIDHFGYNIRCLSGDSLCLKGSGKKESISVYISFFEFWKHIYFIHENEYHDAPYKILKFLKNLKVGYPNMYNDIWLYLLNCFIMLISVTKNIREYVTLLE